MPLFHGTLEGQRDRNRFRTTQCLLYGEAI